MLAGACENVPGRLITLLSSSFSGNLGEASPKTDINDGKESGTGGGLV